MQRRFSILLISFHSSTDNQATTDVNLKYKLITNPSQLADLCCRVATAATVAFDTEFVSEFSYYPQLCLIQVALDEELFIVDTCEVPNVDSFWQALTEGDHETIVHAGREEFRFALRSVGQGPRNWFDIQLAAGMVGIEYPASYGKLTARLLNKKVPKGETRTDWRRRPLTPDQLEYALSDVTHLKPMRDKLQERLARLNHGEWHDDESRIWQQSLIEFDSKPRWRRVSGISGLNPTSLAIVREISKWRDEEAKTRDIPSKRVLRDDLIVELARRRSPDEKKIRAIRGLDRRDLKDQYGKLSQAISDAIDSPEPNVSRRRQSELSTHLNQIVSLLGAALDALCREQSIAPSIVGTAQDLRDLVAYKLEPSDDAPPPRLAEGWRAGVVGQKIERLLNGQLAIRIRDPFSDIPLEFKETQS